MEQIKHIKHQDIDFAKWDKAISLSEIPFVFAQSFYLNATCPAWDALVIGDYESVFPLTYKTKFGYKYLPQPPFTSQLGAYGIVNLETEQLFYNYILANYKLIEIELNTSNQLKTEYISPKNTYFIEYEKGYKINQNTKRNIAKAVESGFMVEQVSNDQIVPLSQKYLNPFLESELKLSRSTLVYLDNLLLNGIANHTITTFKVIDQKNKIRALGHFLSNGKHTLYLKGTNFDREENSGSMHLLMKHAIEFFCNRSQLFDFGGGSNSEGLANFYKGFGGQAMTYSFLRVNRLSGLIKFIKSKN